MRIQNTSRVNHEPIINMSHKHRRDTITVCRNTNKKMNYLIRHIVHLFATVYHLYARAYLLLIDAWLSLWWYRSDIIHHNTLWYCSTEMLNWITLAIIYCVFITNCVDVGIILDDKCHSNCCFHLFKREINKRIV